ncbi:hypothetical protein GZ998_01565 [Actinomyces sp. 594]|uniref:hypothetical protein n=1 Tax=Actinomyces sp. 594 TaxID=2057793 RepID=UPI001C55AEB0|nr:hypothetical protein [Actinomyces sp. 594]MBW3068208.1 hypothetical protein [Actinomyces sp. 594]
MPRIITAVTQEVPEVLDVVSLALARDITATYTRTADNAAVAIFTDFSDLRPSLEIVRPSLVADARELTRIFQVDFPRDWEPPYVINQFLVPWEERCDVFTQVPIDVGIMFHGVAVSEGSVLPVPEPWWWRVTEEGRWRPTRAAQEQWRRATIDRPTIDWPASGPGRG